MHAPDCFYIYGYCDAQYQGPKEGLGMLPTTVINAVEVRQFDITIYKQAEITKAKLVSDFNEDTIHKDFPKALKIPVKTKPGIYFPAPVFDNVTFVRDNIIEAYFINPTLNGITKKDDYTYGSISGWGYFKVGKELPPIVEPPLVENSNYKATVTIGTSKPTAKPIRIPLPPSISFNKSIFPGCLGPLFLICLLSLFMFQVCNNNLNFKNNTNLKDENPLKDTLSQRGKFVEGDKIIIPPDDGKIGSDSIKINDKNIPVPVTKDYLLLVYDFDKKDDDQISLSYNGQLLLDHSIVNFEPKIIRIKQIRKGDNYLHIVSTSQGKAGICTPRLTLIKNGNILYNKTIGCRNGIINRLTLKFI